MVLEDMQVSLWSIWFHQKSYFISNLRLLRNSYKEYIIYKIQISLRCIHFNGDVLRLIYVYGHTGIINNIIYICTLYNLCCSFVHSAIDYMSNKWTWKSVKNSESQRTHFESGCITNYNSFCHSFLSWKRFYSSLCYIT